ncbi:MAG TPA: MGMT family protein [Polyangia bacterium]|nr:MGMT family protein [Polyangia bacterium]
MPRAARQNADPYELIYRAVARVPRGRVATYGQIATLAGLPRRARLVGRALRILPANRDVPWYRIVNAAGRVSARGDAFGSEDLQAQLLEREGVALANGRIALETFQWRPRA